MEITFLRHGRSCANGADTKDPRRWIRSPLLTINGYNQAMSIGFELKEELPEYIVCTLLPRSMLTACIIAKCAGIDVVYVHPYFGEEENLGEQAGKVIWTASAQLKKLAVGGRVSPINTQNYSDIAQSVVYGMVVEYIVNTVLSNKIPGKPVRLDFSNIPKEAFLVKGILPEEYYNILSAENINRNLIPVLQVFGKYVSSVDKFEEEFIKIGRNMMLVGHGKVFDKYLKKKLQHDESIFQINSHITNCAYLKTVFLSKFPIVPTLSKKTINHINLQHPLQLVNKKDIIKLNKSNTFINGLLTCRYKWEGMICIPYFCELARQRLEGSQVHILDTICDRTNFPFWALEKDKRTRFLELTPESLSSSTFGEEWKEDEWQDVTSESNDLAKTSSSQELSKLVEKSEMQTLKAFLDKLTFEKLKTWEINLDILGSPLE
jgi:hypothetical protein